MQRLQTLFYLCHVFYVLTPLYFYFNVYYLYDVITLANADNFSQKSTT